MEDILPCSSKKKSHPSVINDYRPVALTSLIMKVLERQLLPHLSKQTRTYQDPLQFAYHSGVGVEDAIIHLLQPTHCHLDKAGSTVRIMFFDFSSAFNTIQPDLLCQKLQKTQVKPSTIAWINDYLTNRPQFETEGLCVKPGVPQHKSTTGDRTLTIPFPSVHLRLPV